MISQQEYKQRRDKLAQALPKDSVAIITAAKEQSRNGDSHFRFRQNSYFYYLTGFSEENATLIVCAGKPTESILFCQPHDFTAEQWTGRRLGVEGALSELRMDKAFEHDMLHLELPNILMHKCAIYYLFSQPFLYEQLITPALLSLKSKVRQGIKAPDALHDLEPIVSEMRLFKSEAELAIMRDVAALSAKAHARIMQACPTLKHEYELEALFTYELNRQGCRDMAYPPIVGSGENSCILHYTENNRPLKDGDLVLVDAGGELYNYAADITRTFPVNGTFSAAQKSIYNLVLKAQQAGIAAIRPGLSWNAVQEIIVRIITEGLCTLGILSGSIDELIAAEAYKPFYMHRSGHWLGLDVHDCGPYKINGEWRPLMPGMVLTVEPGIYIMSETKNVDKQFWGIGVRIEDDVLVTESGHEILSKGCATTAEEIEDLMSV